MMEVIQIVSAHTADVIVHMLQILSDKYSHPIEEMLECIRTNPQFHSINIHPILTKEFFESNTLPAPKKVGKKPKVIPNPIVATPIATDTISVPLAAPISPKRVVKIIKKAVTPIIITDTIDDNVTALASPSSTASNESSESQDSVIINMPQPVAHEHTIIAHDDEEVAIKPTEPPKPVKKVIKIVKKIVVPETTVPETTVPETTVPETTVPETAVLETTVPETTVPETTVPETTVPETIHLVGDSKEIKSHTY
jgi:hypothetical protein